jgi:hypothetical protein
MNAPESYAINSPVNTTDHLKALKRFINSPEIHDTGNDAAIPLSHLQYNMKDQKTMNNVLNNNIFDNQEEESTGPTSLSAKSDNENQLSVERKSLTSLFEHMGFKRKNQDKKTSAQNSSSDDF